MGAAAGARGATRQSQALYEKGERMPDAAYLGAVAGAGCDVLYILTGQRLTSNASTPPPLPNRAHDLKPEHQALIANYDACAPDDQAAIRKVVAAAAKPRAVEKRRAKAG